MFQLWNEGIAEIDNDYHKSVTEHKVGDLEYENKKRNDKDNRDRRLASLNQETERILINMNHQVDHLGSGAVGGLRFSVSRSQYYAQLLDEGIESLRVGQIDTWWSYAEFAKRSMDPVFKEIASVGDRLERVRTRLLAAMQSIQTSSIVNQTEATRDNTFQLERIARHVEKLVEGSDALKRRLAWLSFWVGCVFFGILGLAIKAFWPSP